MINLLPSVERPRERCLAFGAETLSLRECFALLLGSGPRGKGCMGIAAELVGAHAHDAEDSFFMQWLHVGPPLLKTIGGIGPAQEARLLACLEIAKRFSRVLQTAKNVPKTLNLSTLEQRALQKIPLAKRTSSAEWFGFFGVFKNGSTTELRLVSEGAKNQVHVDQQKLFLQILLTGAPAFILVHNHPSGDLEPSIEDRALTHRIKNLAAQLSLQCLSHLIVTDHDATSFDS